MLTATGLDYKTLIIQKKIQLVLIKYLLKDLDGLLEMLQQLLRVEDYQEEENYKTLTLISRQYTSKTLKLHGKPALKKDSTLVSGQDATGVVLAYKTLLVSRNYTMKENTTVTTDTTSKTFQPHGKIALKKDSTPVIGTAATGHYSEYRQCNTKI